MKRVTCEKRDAFKNFIYFSLFSSEDWQLVTFWLRSVNNPNPLEFDSLLSEQTVIGTETVKSEHYTFVEVDGKDILK